MAAPNHKVSAKREVAVWLLCLSTCLYTIFSIDLLCKWRARSVSHHIYFSDPKFMYDLPSRDPKIESFLIVERRPLSI